MTDLGSHRTLIVIIGCYSLMIGELKLGKHKKRHRI